MLALRCCCLESALLDLGRPVRASAGRADIAQRNKSSDLTKRARLTARPLRLFRPQFGPIPTAAFGWW